MTSIKCTNNAIFLAFNHNYANKAFHCLNSIKENYPDHPKIIICYEGPESKILEKLRKYSNIELIINLELPKDIIIPGYHKDVQSKMVYYKYLLWTDMFQEYDNILHLDADTIVRAPLDTLFKGEEFFIVKNNLYFKEIQILDKSKDINGDLELLLDRWGMEYPKQQDMVNAGVFMIPKSYRIPDQYWILLKITEAFGKYLKYADQSALSLWCIKNKIKASEQYQYNFQTPLFTKFLMPRYNGYLDIGWFLSKKSILNKVDIIHFSGPIKPDSKKFLKWNIMGRYAKIFRDCYFHYGNPS
jgi:lipopolysaccharide biosynthesis glycosyltransferase